MQNGPVQAGMILYESFKNYQSGIYTSQSGQMIGWHALTLVGWGEEDGVQYFIGLNSWGKNWGENGYVRIDVSSMLQFLIMDLLDFLMSMLLDILFK